MASDERFDHESYQDVETIRQYFISMVDGMEKGRISLNTEKDRIDMKVSPFMKFRVKARKKDNKVKIEMAISWRDAREEKTRENIHIG